MSLASRFLESHGFPTASVYLLENMVQMHPAPRMLQVKWPFGHPFGEPDKPQMQAMVIHQLLELARNAKRPHHLVQPDWPWRRTTVELPETWVQSLKEQG